MDYFSKWQDVPTPNQEATTVLENVIALHGVSLEIHSDQGRNLRQICRNEKTHGFVGINKEQNNSSPPTWWNGWEAL